MELIRAVCASLHVLLHSSAQNDVAEEEHCTCTQFKVDSYVIKSVHHFTSSHEPKLIQCS
jgi:hypothetical protein